MDPVKNILGIRKDRCSRNQRVLVAGINSYNSGSLRKGIIAGGGKIINSSSGQDLTGNTITEVRFTGDENKIHKSIMKVLSRGDKIPDNDKVEWYSGISWE